jgi:hypothetical protein
MNDIAEDLLVGGYLALPGLEQSQNPDVARFARGANEVATATIRWAIVLEAMKWLSVLILVPYWIGSSTLLVATGLTGWPFLLILTALAVGVPVLAFHRHWLVKVAADMVLATGLFYGAWYLFTAMAA